MPSRGPALQVLPESMLCFEQGRPRAGRQLLREGVLAAPAVRGSLVLQAVGMDDPVLALELVENGALRPETAAEGQMALLLAVLHSEPQARAAALARHRRDVRKALRLESGVGVLARTLTALESGEGAAALATHWAARARRPSAMPYSSAGHHWALAGLMAARSGAAATAVACQSRSALAHPVGGLHQELRQVLGLPALDPQGPERTDKEIMAAVREQLASGSPASPLVEEGVVDPVPVVLRLRRSRTPADFELALPAVDALLRARVVGRALREVLLLSLALGNGVSLGLKAWVADPGPGLEAVEDVLQAASSGGAATARAQVAFRRGRVNAVGLLVGDREGENESWLRALSLWREGLLAQSAVHVRAARQAPSRSGFAGVWQDELAAAVGA